MPAVAVESYKIGDYTWHYTLSGTKATIIGVSPSSGDITIPELIAGNIVTDIGGKAFYLCNDLRSVIIPDSVLKIGDDAFRGCMQLDSLIIPDSVTNIEENAFYECYPGVVRVPQYVCSQKFQNTFPSSYDSISNVIVSSSTGDIANDAFYGCAGMTNIVIPQSVTNIGSRAFGYCSGLTEVDIPNSVTSIGQEAFSYCSGIASITIPPSVTNFGAVATFYGCTRLRSITVAQPLCSRQISSILHYTTAEAITNVVVSPGVASIGDHAFSGFKCLAALSLPDTVTNIGMKAFEDCKNLKTLNIPRGVSRIGAYAFYQCSNLQSINIPDTIIDIGTAAFYACNSLTDLAIPDSVTNIDAQAFYSCTNLATIVIGDGVKTIGKRAFALCKNLKSVRLGKCVSSIGEKAFYNCKTILSVEVSEPVCYLGLKSVFSGSATTITDVVISYGTTSTDSCCDGIVALKKVTIPESVTHIGGYAFRNCSNLTSVTVPASVKTISSTAFSGCSGLRCLTFHGNAPRIPDTSQAILAEGCKAYVRRSASGWPKEGEVWCGLEIVYYGGGSDKAEVSESAGGYEITAHDGENLGVGDVKFTSVVDGSIVDATLGYEVEIAPDGKNARATLKGPRFGATSLEYAEVTKDEGDSSGVLAIVEEGQLATKPDAKYEESIGALPLDAVIGLYYQAAWGNDVGNLTTGEKVQATTNGILYLGVIKQTGDRGFYRVNVSEL